jgi:hypothetical protein
VLTPAQDAFVRAYVAGESETVGNARRSYMLAFPKCKSLGAASVSASRLLSKAVVRARMAELRQQAERDARARLRSWWALAPDAQTTLELASAGLFDPMPDAPHGVRSEAIRSGVRAAQEILNRAEGTPQQLHELRITAGITVAVAGPEVGRLVELPAEDTESSLQNGHYLPSGAPDSVQDARIAAPHGEKWTDVGERPHEQDSEHDRPRPRPASEPDKEGRGGGPDSEGPPERYRAPSQ